jgi:orotidine-5'-phosphate decarboxylase
VSFCREIVAATEPVAAAFKINFAFFEALGPDGWRALAQVRSLIPVEIPVIADAKRGDIGNTASAYARAIFDWLDFDAATINPYLGWDSMQPFLHRHGRLAFVLAKTSNPGARDFQDLDVGGEPLYLHIARSAIEHERPAEIGLVVGATYPDALGRVRALDPDRLLLVPGVGAQGANPAETFRLASNSGSENALIVVSRTILHASSGPDFGDAAARAARAAASALHP